MNREPLNPWTSAEKRKSGNIPRALGDTLPATLEQSNSCPLKPLRLLKAGTEKPPVFIAHGLGGSVAEVSQLGRHIPLHHPVYGLQAKGTDGKAEPLDRIEDMAQFHLDQIEELQPRGPYFLIGYSLGGLIMLEVARCLSQRGEKVGLLVMIDSYPHKRYLSLGLRMRLAGSRAKRHVATVKRLPLRKALSYIFHSAERRLLSEGAGERDLRLTDAFLARRARDSAYLAWTRYEPRFYSGTIKFLKAAVRSEFPDDPDTVWAHLADKLEVETVAGNHRDMIEKHFASLATVLSHHLQEALDHG